MKRVDLLKKLNRKGYVFVRHGGNHDWYQNPETKMCQPIPKHREVNELIEIGFPPSAAHRLLSIRSFWYGIVDVQRVRMGNHSTNDVLGVSVTIA